MASKLLLALLAAACLHAGVAQAQQQPHPLSNLPPPGSITTGFFFPGNEAKRFTVGETVKVVAGIRNEASEAYNITAILGSVNMASDFRLYVQNFTEQVYHQPINAGDELSVEYKFAADPRIPTLGTDSFVLALTVLYHDNAGKYFSNTFFNQTVTIVDVKRLIDWELVFLFIILGGLAAGGAYIAYSYAAPHLQTLGVVKKGKKTKKVEGSAADHHDDWVKGTIYDTHAKKRAASFAKKQAE